MLNSDHERLPLTSDETILNNKKCKCNCKPFFLLLLLFCISLTICILVLIYVIKLIIYELNYKEPNIPIELKNYTIICDTWNGNNHPCLWNNEYCTIKNPCILSCMDYIKFSAGCFHSDCNQRGRYDWCHDRPFGGQDSNIFN